MRNQRARRRLGDRSGTRALVEVLLLHRNISFVAVHAALDAVECLGAVDPALVDIDTGRIAEGGGRARSWSGWRSGASSARHRAWSAATLCSPGGHDEHARHRAGGGEPGNRKRLNRQVDTRPRSIG